MTNSSSDDNPFERYDAPINIIDFGNIVFENFKKCTAEDTKIDNNEIIVRIKKAINEQRVIFRDFIKSSIEFSNEMADFSIDILFFADCFKNNIYSNEEILELLNDLLEKSRENNDRLKSLKNIIADEINEEIVNEPENISYMDELDKILDDKNIGMKEKLIQIHNFLKKYIEDLAHPVEIRKPRKSEFITFRMMLNKILEFLIMNPILAIFAPEVFIVLLCLFGTVAMSGGLGAITGRKQDGLIEKMNQYCESLGLIIIEIGKFETFWVKQIQIFEKLIENLERLSKSGNVRIKLYQFVNRIVQKWNDVSRECELYSKKMKTELDKDRLAG